MGLQRVGNNRATELNYLPLVENEYFKSLFFLRPKRAIYYLLNVNKIILWFPMVSTGLTERCNASCL